MQQHAGIQAAAVGHAHGPGGAVVEGGAQGGEGGWRHSPMVPRHWNAATHRWCCVGVAADAPFTRTCNAPSWRDGLGPLIRPLRATLADPAQPPGSGADVPVL